MDVSPFNAIGNPQINWDPSGTTYVDMFVSNIVPLGTPVVTWTFDGPVIAWGADFRSQTDDPNEMVRIDMAPSFLDVHFPNDPNTVPAFFGVKADSGFTSVTFSYAGPLAFGALHIGVDDLDIVDAPIPEPSGLTLLGLGGLLLLTTGRRTRRTPSS